MSNVKIIPYDPSDFICRHCELPQQPSPTWEEYCIDCCIMILESDIEINREAKKNA